MFFCSTQQHCQTEFAVAQHVIKESRKALHPWTKGRLVYTCGSYCSDRGHCSSCIAVASVCLHRPQAVHPDGDALVTGSKSGKLHVWDVPSQSRQGASPVKAKKARRVEATGGEDAATSAKSELKFDVAGHSDTIDCMVRSSG